MINNTFQEQLNKNRVLTDDVDCIDVVVYEKFRSKMYLKLKNIAKRYGFISVSLSGLKENFTLKYSNIILLNAKVDGEYFIPLNFVTGELLCIEGSCEKILLRLYGAKFEHVFYDLILPKNKMVVKGQCLCSVNNYEDIIASDFYSVLEYHDNLFFQAYIYENNVGVGRLFQSKGLRFARNHDDFSSNLLITNDNVLSAIFVQDCEQGVVFFIYVKDRKVFYKKYNVSTNVISEELLLIDSDVNSKILVASSVNGSMGRFFSVVADDNISVFVCKGGLSIEKVYSGKSKSISMVEYDNALILYLYEDNNARRIEFSYDLNNNDDCVLNVIKNDFLNNVIDVLEYDSMYIYTSTSGCKGLVGFDE